MINAIKMVSTSRKVLDGLRNLDAYPKPLEDFSEKTVGGAAVSVISHIIMLFLVLSELNDYLSSSVTEELFVDVSRGSKLKINLDIVVPGIACPFLGLDAVDSSGEQHLQLTHNIFKRRLDASGKPIEEPKKTEALGSTKVDEFKVREAYRLKQWAVPNPDTVEQCRNENYSEQLKSAFLEGCQVYGYLEVNRLSYCPRPELFHQPLRHLSFGQAIPGKGSPLDNHQEIAEKGSTMFQYYVKIVPTTYVRRDGAIFHTNQFSVTKHSKVVSIGSGDNGMPGIFFSYELSPMMVRYTETEKSLGHFLTNVCAMVGGVYTVAGIFDSLIHRAVLSAQRRSMGKVH
ncbi:hypothetical protein B566_EDAN001540 [Ephemera danica]|nr:hypothetical protein B566_EDAN001540 [Ephemera danica]